MPDLVTLNEEQTKPEIESETLKTKLAEIKRMAQQGQSQLQKGDPSSAPVSLEIITQLVRNLDALDKRILQIEAERNNLRALAEIGQVVNSSLEVDEVLRIVMDTIIRLSGAERGFLMLRNAGGEMSIHIARNWEHETISPSEFEISRTVINRVIKEGQGILTTNAQEDPRFGGQQSIIAYSLRSILCVPLKVKGELTGVIYADNRIRTGIFTEVERNLLSDFANQAASAIENARLFASVRHTLAEVTELKNLMDNVFASIASGVLTTDIDDKITLCNQAAQSLLDKNLLSVLGEHLNKVFPIIEPELSVYTQSVRQENKSIVGLELQPHIQGKGPAVWSLNLSPLKDASQTTQGVAIVLDDLTEKKRLEAQRQLFEKMVSPAVISQLNPNQLELGGKRADITTMFCDIRGFTHYSEEQKPERLVSILNRYLAAAADAILFEEGTIDKFMGDAVMAWFNAPILQSDHTLRAVRAAIRVRQAVEQLHKELPPDAQLAFGIGIHFGEAVLGLIGNENRMEYTAIGDSVNTAKRIQENSAANQILISAVAYRFVQERVKGRQMKNILAKGKSGPLEVYEIIEMI